MTLRLSERNNEHFWLQSEVDKAREQLTAFGGLQLATTWVNAAEFVDSTETVMFDSWDQQFCGV